MVGKDHELRVWLARREEAAQTNSLPDQRKTKCSGIPDGMNLSSWFYHICLLLSSPVERVRGGSVGAGGMGEARGEGVLLCKGSHVCARGVTAVPVAPR